ncbi:MAG: DEAD/DEAH box helicase family protein, partial [Methanocorpusculum sp.]|nr:DEAD/DEAH box helicase family protein [Methanocorpusculum sp.]
ASFIESVYFSNELYPEQQDAIFVWLSDSPRLNEQSKMKIDLKADKIRLNQCVAITEDSFDAEYLEDGKIYFLNTQKLGKNSNLTKHSDARQYTIWETLANTARDKNDRLYIIIDEAHRGMQGDAKKATSIMQKFLKGSAEDSLESMPVVIGMSATPERFNKLVEGTTSTIYRVVVSPEDVRASGLLKDRIIITYPDNKAGNKDMAVLQAAADDWKEKWEHWSQYCQEQHYAHVNPVFVIQVENGSGKEISATDLSDCLLKIEDRTGFRFKDGEVVHTFGQTESALIINGLTVRYEEPSRISDDRKIKVVFFKENLSTGWDCPRAETMMSFRHAKDSTYIAQLLGRMIRTPMQMHILVDDVLNDVHLYLPYFDKDKVKDVVDALQSTEGGTIPTEIQGEELGRKIYDVLTIKPAPQNPKPKTHNLAPGQVSLFSSGDSAEFTIPTENPAQKTESDVHVTTDTKTEPASDTPNISWPSPVSETGETYTPTKKWEPEPVITDTFDREAVMRFINTSGFPTYHIRKVRISSYLNSLYEMARFLTQSGLYPNAAKDVRGEIAEQIHHYIETLKATGKYDNLVSQVLEFKLSTQIFDVFGKSVDNYQIHNLFTTTDTDIDRQLRAAESRLGNEGISRVYGERYYDYENPNAYKIDVVIF